MYFNTSYTFMPSFSAANKSGAADGYELNILLILSPLFKILKFLDVI